MFAKDCFGPTKIATEDKDVRLCIVKRTVKRQEGGERRDPHNKRPSFLQPCNDEDSELRVLGRTRVDQGEFMHTMAGWIN